jgi:predicted nucleic acid-binding Zn ribbon protein
MKRQLRRRSSDGIESIDKIINKIFTKGKFGGRAQVAQLWGQWKDIVGEAVALHSFPEEIKNGKLYIKVDNPIWHQQLDVLKEELKDKIESKIEIPGFEKIVFRSITPNSARQEPPSFA